MTSGEVPSMLKRNAGGEVAGEEAEYAPGIGVSVAQAPVRGTVVVIVFWTNWEFGQFVGL